MGLDWVGTSQPQSRGAHRTHHISVSCRQMVPALMEQSKAAASAAACAVVRGGGVGPMSGMKMRTSSLCIHGCVF
jgi:hypothetical protein